MKDYYEKYWQRPDTYAQGDPLAGKRLALLWQSVADSNLQPKKLLDVGCGEGDVVADAAERGLTAVGVDISSQAIARARQLHPLNEFHVHPVEDRPWPVSDGRFDLITSFEVVEHLMQPREFVLGCHDALEAGGYLALTTPYHGRIKNIAMSLVAFEKHFAVEGDHIRFFTDASLRRLLERDGFSVESIRHFGRGYGLWAGVFVWARKR